MSYAILPPEKGEVRPTFEETLFREWPRLTAGMHPMQNAQPIRELIMVRWETGYYDVPEQPKP